VANTNGVRSNLSSGTRTIDRDAPSIGVNRGLLHIHNERDNASRDSLVITGTDIRLRRLDGGISRRMTFGGRP
jgi:hypothetical protein